MFITLCSGEKWKVDFVVINVGGVYLYKYNAPYRVKKKLENFFCSYDILGKDIEYINKYLREYNLIARRVYAYGDFRTYCFEIVTLHKYRREIDI